ncbi:hypothetical protein J4G37_20700 [Microvirga sp. 3-52]|nr:hypothetical protein [Microvirga sp. 3-52]
MTRPSGSGAVHGHVGHTLSIPRPPWSRTRLRPAPAFVTPSAVMAGLDPAIPML